jgi:hypothetical protein
MNCPVVTSLRKLLPYLTDTEWDLDAGCSELSV